LKELGPEVYAKLDDTLDSIISKLSKNESDETVDMIVDLIIRYYESDALRVILETIREAAPKEVERLSKLLAEYGAARVGEVTETLHTQIEVIEVLRRKVGEGVLEAEIHRVIAKNIWLLRDDLTYWFDNKPFATTLGKALKKKFRLSARNRPDLVCFDDRPLRERQGQDPQKILVVEFKRPGVKVGLKELTQVMQYKNVFEESLGSIDGSAIEVIVLGDRFDSGFDRKSINETPNYKIMSYEELLVNASDRYRDLYRRLVPDGLGQMDAVSKPRRKNSSRKRKASLDRPGCGTRARPLAHSRLDPVSRYHRVLVLPDADYGPTVLPETSVGFAIPFSVAVELALPPLGVGLWPGAVLGTGVPEAAVDVDGDAGGPKDDVGTGANAWDRSAVDPEADAAAVELGADGALGQRVPPAELRHLGALSG
jgi:hypothetical protein